MAFCQADAEPKAALKVEKRLLDWPPRSVPSGTKLRVISSGWGQRFPEAAYGTVRDSSGSRPGRARGARAGRGPGLLRNRPSEIMTGFLGREPFGSRCRAVRFNGVSNRTARSCAAAS